MSDQVAIKTWGNSQGIRIPKNILENFDSMSQILYKLK